MKHELEIVANETNLKKVENKSNSVHVKNMREKNFPDFILTVSYYYTESKKSLSQEKMHVIALCVDLGMYFEYNLVAKYMSIRILSCI